MKSLDLAERMRSRRSSDEQGPTSTAPRPSAIPGIEVLANTVHDTSNDGFTLASEMGGQVERVFLHDNVSYNNRFLGINVSRNGTSATHPMRDAVIVNNTVVGNGIGGWGGGIAVDSLEVERLVVANGAGMAGTTKG